MNFQIPSELALRAALIDDDDAAVARAPDAVISALLAFRDRHPRTAIMIAALLGCRRVITAVILRGAKLEETDDEGTSAQRSLARAGEAFSHEGIRLEALRREATMREGMGNIDFATPASEKPDRKERL